MQVAPGPNEGIVVTMSADEARDLRSLIAYNITIPNAIKTVVAVDCGPQLAEAARLRVDTFFDVIRDAMIKGLGSDCIKIDWFRDDLKAKWAGVKPIPQRAMRVVAGRAIDDE